MSSELDRWLLENENKIIEKDQDCQDESSREKKKQKIYELDLHGYRVSEAILALESFIKKQNEQVRKIRVIHGKGLHSGRPGILNEEIHNWLRKKYKEKIYIKDFSLAKPSEGGHGATIVWLL